MIYWTENKIIYTAFGDSIAAGYGLDDPDDGFFRIAGEAVGRIRRTPPRQQPVPDPEHFWDPPVVPVQEEPAPDEGQFWDLPDLTVQEEPASSTYSSCRPDICTPP